MLVLLAAGGVAGCGGGDDGGGRAATTITAATTPEAGGSLALPREVPTTGSDRPADPVSARVVKKWLRALRRGDTRRAARFFALPSRVQNGTPVLTLASPEARFVFNDSLPCGARATRLRRARNGFTIVEVVLTERRGGACGSGVGGRARTAIRVRGGHIVDWYRLQDAAPAPATPAPTVPGTPAAPTV